MQYLLYTSHYFPSYQWLPPLAIRRVFQGWTQENSYLNGRGTAKVEKVKKQPYRTIIFDIQTDSLNGEWNTFWQHIDDRTLTELAMLSDLFETRGAHAVIAAEEINDLLARITQLRHEIRESELSSTLKTLSLKQLSQIQEALESYSISGVEPVMDAIQSTLGLAVMHPEYRKEISKGAGSQFGEKISSLLTDTASVVTIAGAMPAISCAIHVALTYLTK